MQSVEAARLTSGSKLDASWLHTLRRSGWQGWTLFAGGDDVLDQTLLFWEEGKASSRTLNLTLRIRKDCDSKVRASLEAHPDLQSHEGSIPYPRKQVVAGEVHPLDRQWSMFSGVALEVALQPHLRVRYFPYLGQQGEDNETLPFSTQGSLTLVYEQARVDLAEMHSLLQALGSLGVSTELSSPKDLEYLFLRKLAWACHLDEACLGPVWSAPAEERNQTLRRMLEAHLGVAELSREVRFDPRPHFGSAYNPWADAVGSGQAGGPHWYRFDLEESLRTVFHQTYLGHDLAVEAPNLGDRVARIIRSTGYLLSAEERWMRLGTPSQSIFGPQGRTGGGTHVRMKLLHHLDEATLVFSPILLRRLDAIALDAGLSPEGLTPALLSERINLRQLRQRAPLDVYFKRSVSLMDTLVRINLGSDSDRHKVLEAFYQVGIQKVRGVSVEHLVQVVDRPISQETRP